ncbi:MAG: 30S ribosomal protein S3, partial [Promethearchaeota archaeon]
TPLGTRITIEAARPGLVIGKKGSNVKKFTEILATEFKIENPQIDVEEVKNAELNAQIMAERLASALEKGQHYRRAGYGLLRRIMRAGAKGCEIIISGKITSQRARYQKMKQGIIIKCGEPVRDISYGVAHAKLKAGILGIRVKILPPDYYNPKEYVYIGREGLSETYLDKLSEIESEKVVEEIPAIEEEIIEEVVEVPEVDKEIVEELALKATEKIKGQIVDDEELIIEDDEEILEEDEEEIIDDAEATGETDEKEKENEVELKEDSADEVKEEEETVKDTENAPAEETPEEKPAKKKRGRKKKK